MNARTEPPRVAIYARYSSDLQRPTSIEDQVALCRRRATEIGATVAEVYSDAAASGSGTHDRPGYKALLAAVRARRFDVVLVEALDRLSRDQADTATAFKLFRFADCRILSVNEGEIGALHIGMKGTMNALYLEDLGNRVRRGQRGALERGRVPAGLAYGYRAAPVLRADGTVDRGHRVIEPAEAEIVRRIFREYVAGRTPRAIVADLNAEGIPSPRGGQWNASTLNGSGARATGILRNPVYVGRVLLNRQAFRKDPETGKRVPKVNGRADWIEAEAPELAIVDRATFDMAQGRKAANEGVRTEAQRGPRKILSGLVRCAKCGSAMTASSKSRFACAGRRERGICDNGQTVDYDELEARVLGSLKTELLAPDAVREFVATYRAERKRIESETAKRTAKHADELVGIDRQLSNLVDMLADGAGEAAPSIMARVRALEARKVEIAADAAALAAAPGPVVDLHPDLPARYARLVGTLDRIAAAEPEVRETAARAVRELVLKVEIAPTGQRGGYEIAVHGRLAALLEAAGVPGVAETLRRPGLGGTVSAVAAEGFGRHRPLEEQVETVVFRMTRLPSFPGRPGPRK